MDFSTFLEELPDPEGLLYEQNLFSTFTTFPKLPIEVRLKIWELSFCGPRTVVVEINRDDTFISDCPTPITLSINKEARQIAQESYKNLSAKDSTKPIYFSPPRDSINLRGLSPFATDVGMTISISAAQREVLGWVQALKLEHVWWTALYRQLLLAEGVVVSHVCLLFSGLRELTRVADNRVVISLGVRTHACGQLGEKSGREDFASALSEYLEMKTAEASSFSIPAITILGPQKERDVTVERYEEENSFRS